MRTRAARRPALVFAAAGFVLAAALFSGCATPFERVGAQAAAAGLAPEVLQGEAFRHRAWFRPGEGGGELHVYLEHDGTPWIGATRVAADPTPREPVMPDLIALDPAPVLYLGRPCHFGLAADPGCEPLVWTHRRYAPEVVDSLAAALRRFLATHPHERLVFIGHSGGGALAVLLAERFDATVAVVTLGANLDIERWARVHDYSPLDGSLNPIDRPPLAPAIVQRHYVGADDRNVPPAIVRAYARTRPGVEAIELPGVDHACCWRERWPGLLADLRERLAGR